MDTSLRQQLDLLAIACRILAMEGHDDRTLGHLALRDPAGRGAWLKRSGIGLDELLDARDFILIDFDGNLLEGDGMRHGEWPIHTEIMQRRPDIQVTGHTHALYSAVFSACCEPLRPVAGAGSYLRCAPPRFTLTSELIVTRARGAQVAETLGAQSMTLFLRNHGIVFCGVDIANCLTHGIVLDQACRQMLLAGGSGLKWEATPEPEQTAKHATIAAFRNHGEFLEYYRRKLERRERVHPPPGTRAALRRS